MTILEAPSLTPDERRALGIAALTTAVSALVSGLVTWGLDAVKRRASKPPETPAEGGTDGAPGA